jgi:paraquat-inducible protein B
MSRKASPAMIGAFVIAGLALLVVGVLIFGGLEIFRDKQRFVTYFESSVQGLRIGSDVLFRGARVGYVTSIQVTADETMLDYQIPVTFEILPGSVKVLSGGTLADSLSADDSRLQDMIAAGLRTRLDVESFVTGQLVINLDMYPGTQAVFRGQDPPYPEIPSIPSEIRQAMERIQGFLTAIENKVPIEQIVDDLVAGISGFEQLMNSPDLKASLAGINKLVNSRDARELPGALRAATAELQAAAADARGLIGNVDSQLEPALRQAVPVMEQLQTTLREGEAVLSLARGQLESNPETAAQLTNALRELERSARAIRQLVDSLERQPESLLRGKQKP